MHIKLNVLGNLLRFKYILATLLVVYLGVFREASVVNKLVSTSIILLVVVIIPILCKPKAMDISENTIRYKERVMLYPQGYNSGHYSPRVRITIMGVNVRSALYKRANVTFEVKEVTSCELIQSPLERLFNVGRIRFYGYTHSEADRDLKNREYREKDVHCLYGITNFDLFCHDVKKYISCAREEKWKLFNKNK